MSHYMTALAMKQKGLKPAAKIVLYWLAEHYNGETGRCFPSTKTLSEECEMSRAAVFRYLAELEETGLIERQNRYRDNGSRTSSGYVLKLRLPPSQNETAPCVDLREGLSHNETAITLELNPGSMNHSPSYEGERAREEGDLFDAQTGCEPDHDAGNPEVHAEADVERTAGSGPDGDAGSGEADRRPATTAAKPKRQSASRKQQFPEDWWPNAKGIAFAEQHGCPDLAANVSACVDFHRGKGTTFADLNRAWQTWCRNADEKYGWHGGGNGGQHSGQATAGGNGSSQAYANGGAGGGYSNAGDRAREANNRVFAAAARLSAKRKERDRAWADGGGPDTVPIVDLAAWRDSGTG